MTVMINTIPVSVWTKLSFDLWKHISLATEAPSDYFDL